MRRRPHGPGAARVSACVVCRPILQFLENVIAHPLFRSGECTTRFIDTTPELFNFVKRRDRATR